MILAFELSMPGVNSWNGKWSGEDRKHVIVKSFRSKKMQNKLRPLVGEKHYYDFGDGWTAGVKVFQVDSNQARRLRKQSVGFCGYNWMVNSLIDRGYISTE